MASWRQRMGGGGVGSVEQKRVGERGWGVRGLFSYSQVCL